MGDGPANPDLLMPLVVRLFEALSHADDGPLATKRAERSSGRPSQWCGLV
jgi:hypothetical protein